MDEPGRYQKVKQHLKDNKKIYLAMSGSVVFAGISCFIVRGIASQRIDRGISVVADRSVVTNNVSLISSRRQGAPSWVIRCLETGKILSSQLSAAKEMELPASEISKQLNGIMDHVRGYHFERICIAA
jgi:hypothetical protein